METEIVTMSLTNNGNRASKSPLNKKGQRKPNLSPTEKAVVIHYILQLYLTQNVVSDHICHFVIDKATPHFLPKPQSVFGHLRVQGLA